MNKTALWMRGLMIVCAAALVMALGMGAGAQSYRGAILGTVMDSSGGSVAGANVTVKNLDTGLTRTTVTADDGSYKVPELPIGNYSVSVEKAGFRTGVVTPVRVEVASSDRVDVTLQPGEISQKVEVTGESLPQIETTSNTMGGIVQSSSFEDLPVNGRDYQKLIYLVPGVAGSPDQITDSPGSYGIFSMNGARGRSNNYLLDGTDMNDGYRNDPSINEAGVFGTPATILPVEAVAEMNVLSNFEPEYGRSAGGVVNIVTKSGTNTWHGSGLEYFRDTALNARNYFDDASAGPQQPFRNNQFGGSLAGPIRKDGTFLFFNYEGMREHGAQSSPACVPTAANIADATLNNGDVVNPVIAALLALNPWPAPTNGNDCYDNGGTNAALATPFSNRVDSLIVKIDHKLNQSQNLTGRYYFGDSDQSFPLALVGGGMVPGYNTATPTRVQVVSLSHVYTLSSKATNEARFGLNRFVEGFFPQDRGFNPSSIGLNTGVGTYDYGLPKISISSPNGSSIAPIGSDNGDPRERVDTNYHFIDNVSVIRGAHAMKFGYEMRRTTIWQMFNRGFRGAINFGSMDDFIGGIPNTDPYRTFQRQGNTSRNTSQNSHSFYAQDSVRWRKDFTINFGLRWDYYGIIKEDNNNFTNVDPLTGAGIILNGANLYAPDKNNFAPRVSLAWDVKGKGKTVVRVGYGVFYDSISHDMFLGHLPWNSVFDPGPAYAGFGPNPITFAFADGTPLNSANSVFPSTGPMWDAFGVDPHLRTPYMQNYNLNLQQELTKKMTLQIGYVGSNGHKLLRFRDINQPSQAEITAEDLIHTCPNPPGPDVPCVNDWGVPRHLPSSPFWYINWEESSANSNYNSLQVSWKLNDWRGLSSTLNFNWSHSLDDASDGEDFVPNAAQPNDSQAPIGMNRGNSNFDVRKHLTWNFSYAFPNRKGSMSKLTDGWAVSGIVTLQSGQPFQLNYNFQGDYDGSGGGFGRPDVVGTITYNRSDPRNFLDLSVFAVPCTLSGGTDSGNCVPGTRHFGNLGRNSLRGPDFRQFDFSIVKDTQLTERLKVQFRAEAFNLLNHPNFVNPYLPYFIADAAPNGIGANGNSLGALSLAATGDVGIGYPFLGSGGPRGLQLAVKFTF